MTNDTTVFSSVESKQFKEQQALKDWLNDNFEPDFEKSRCFSVTLLFVPDLSRQKAMATFKNFVGHLNRRIYGNAYKRFPKEKSVKIVGVIEGGDNTKKSVHYHCVMVNPYENFESLVKDCWLNQPKAMKNSDVSVEIVKVYDLSGWDGYLAKSGSKEKSVEVSYLDCLDIQNSYF